MRITGRSEKRRSIVSRWLDAHQDAALDQILRSHYAVPLEDDWYRGVKERIRLRIGRAGAARSVSLTGRRHVLRWARCIVVLVAAVLCAGGAAVAFSNIVNLGKPTDAVPPGSFPLSGFVRGGQPLSQQGKPEVLFIGTQYQNDQASAAERWPLIKALNQFGTFSNVHPLDRRCTPIPYTTVRLCTLPSFDWSHATYRSRYVAFVHKDLLTPDGLPFQRLSSAEQALYLRYVDGSGAMDAAGIKASILHQQGPGTLPLLSIGHYVQTASQEVVPSDFESYIGVAVPKPSEPLNTEVGYAMATGLPFDMIQTALLSGQDPTDTHLNNDVDAEVNVITTLICSVDGMQPRRVCGRHAVRYILRHVR